MKLLRFGEKWKPEVYMQYQKVDLGKNLITNQRFLQIESVMLGALE